MTLALEGRTCPRRKPGRPRKQKPAQSPLEDRPLTAADNQEGEEAADPELALEQMFKEAEEKRQTQSDLSSRTRRRRKVPQRSSDSPSHSSITNHQANVLLKTGLKVPSKARNLKPFSKRKESLGMKMMMKGAGKNQKQKTQSTSKALAIRIQKTTAMKTILIKYFFIFPKIFSKIFYD